MDVDGAKKIGLAPTQCRELLHTPRERGGLGMESWHSVVLRRRADIAMEWATQRNEQMAAVYHKLREDHEDIKREGAKPGLGWGVVREEGPVEYWPATD